MDMAFVRAATTAFALAGLIGAVGAAEPVNFSSLPQGSYWEYDDETLGKQYAYPADMPNGPYYFVNGDKVTSIRFIMEQSDLAAGKSWPNLEPHEALGSIDHMSLTFQKTVWGDRFAFKPVYVLDIFFVSAHVLGTMK
jgi:hypothetical protein